MIKTDVKQRISALHQLPVLPHMAREILSFLDAGTVHWDELAAIAECDPAMVRQIVAASKAVGSPEGLSLDEQMMNLGIARVTQVVFERVAPALFDSPKPTGLDLKGFWAHSFATARHADRIARKAGSRYQPLAYMAGLLHDIGKPALDRVASGGGYTRALELVRQQGLFALEAERRELGADHTLAGKWLAEAWGLPSSIISAIWLHHHPPGTLDATPYPVELIEIVSLANFLAHGDSLDVPAQERLASLDEQRYLRLGLERIDILDLLRDGKNEPIPTVVSDTLPPEAGSTGESRSETARIRHERDYYEALCTLHERIQPGMALAAQLTLFVHGLRKAFPIPAGLCYLAENTNDAPVVLRWRNTEEEPESVSTASDGTNAATSLDDLIATLRLRDLPHGDTHLASQHGFIALPLLDGNRSIGQLIFQSGGSTLSDNFLNDLMRFVRGAGVALARCKAVRGVNEEAESLAAAVWRQELTHRHDRRTERLISVGKMAAGAAHEINNPLAVISGKAQMLLANTTRPEDEKALSLIVEHSQRATGILRDLLQFARPNPPHLMPARVSHLVKASVDRARTRLTDEGIQLLEEYAQDLPEIPVDRVQLDQVFQNLLKNAEQAMARQGDKLTIRVRPNQDRTAVLVQIIDTGQGISSDIMDKVFEPFFTTQSGAEGSGMGLAVCHGIVEAHRGTITLHSQQGVGTTCTVTLPSSADVSAPLPEKTATPAETTFTDPTPRGPARVDDPPQLVPEVAAALRADAAQRNRANHSTPDAPAPRTHDRRPPSPPEAEAPKATVDRENVTNRNAAAPTSTILLVDEDADLRDVIAEALRNRGYAIRTASDGLEALAEVIANPADLVLLDGAVPGLNASTTLLDEIHSRKPDLPIITLVGSNSKLDVESMAGKQRCDVLHKPFNVAQLFQVIESALANQHVA